MFKHLKHSTLRFLLLSCICLSLTLTGCSSTPAVSVNLSKSSSNKNASAHHDIPAFDALTRKLFLEYVTHDTLSLNYTLKNPSAYDIHPNDVTWGDVPLTQSDFEDEKTDTIEYLSKLNAITNLSEEQTLTYDVLKYYLELELEGYDYIYFTNNFAPMLGIQSQLPITLAEYPFDDLQDVDDYIELLNEMDDYIEDLLAFENAKAAAGLGMCRSALEASIEDCQAFCDTSESNMLIEIFPDRLKALNLSDSDKNTYIQRNKEAILKTVIPAYKQIISILSRQLETAPENGALSSYKNGQNYYKYLLKSSVGTHKTPEELIALTENKLNLSIATLSTIIPNNPSIDDAIHKQVYALSNPKEILEYFESTLTSEQFPKSSDVEYTLKNVHASMADRLSPAMYLIPRIDDFHYNQIYLNIIGSNSGSELMPTLAHEGYPGHMYQMTYYYHTNPNPIRTIYACNGYTEGWASYVEALSYDYCGFSDDIADFHRTFNVDLSLNLYCRLDLGIHYENWSFEEAYAYACRYLDLPEETFLQIYNIILYNPTNYLIYGIGMNEILELKDNMQENLGETFDVKTFHKQLLDMGPAPFPIIKKHMTDAAESTEKSAENAA